MFKHLYQMQETDDMTNETGRIGTWHNSIEPRAGQEEN